MSKHEDNVTKLKEKLGKKPGMYFAKIIHNQSFIVQPDESALITLTPKEPIQVIAPVIGIYIVFGERTGLAYMVTNAICQDPLGKWFVMDMHEIPFDDILSIDRIDMEVYPANAVKVDFIPEGTIKS